MEENKALIVFEGKGIRKIWFKNEWWFSVVDIVGILTSSEDPRNYWKVLKYRLNEEGSEVVTNCNQLKLLSSDGKTYLTDCVNTEGAFRIIQSIPSPKAEPFKLWLAKVGYERVQEIENPELAQDRARKYYELKGYPQDWIEKRVRGIAIRQELTDEWKNRGIQDNKDYAILTNEISKATFGVSIKEHKKIKELDPKFVNQNLRDHMTDWELIFGMLGEKATTDITRTRDDKNFNECRQSAKKGGEIANNARKELEQETKESIVSKKNFLDLTERKKIEQKIKKKQ